MKKFLVKVDMEDDYRYADTRVEASNIAIKYFGRYPHRDIGIFEMVDFIKERSTINE